MNGHQILKLQLQKVADLDLTGRVEIKLDKSVFGGYNDVFQGSLEEDGTTVAVAVKRVKGDPSEESFAMSLAKELRIASKVENENTLRLEGFFLEGDCVLIVTKWAEGGTLNAYIKKHPRSPLLPIASGIAKGLAYLHGIGIIHGDLKGANVLMTSSGKPKLTDYGLSRTLEYSIPDMKTPSYSIPKGSFHWFAYELAEIIETSGIEFKFTKPSDIWAFGMVLYEMITGKVPFAHYGTGAYAIIPVLRAIREKKLPEKPLLTKERDALWNISESCWTLDPAMRPEASEAIRRISDLLAQYGVTSEPAQAQA